MQPRFKNWAQTQDGPSPKVKLEKGGGSQNVKPTCFTCGKKHYGEYILGTKSCYGCDKEGHKVRDFPNISSRGRDDKQVTPIVPKKDAPKAKACFYALRERGEKPDDDDDYEGKSSHLFLVIWFQSKGGNMVSRWDRKS